MSATPPDPTLPSQSGLPQVFKSASGLPVQKTLLIHLTATEVGMQLVNGRDPCRQEVVLFAVLCRAIALLLQAFFNLLVPDHAADAFSPPRLTEPSCCDWLVEQFLGGLSRWDAEHFLFVAEHGYVFEHSFAFFPLFPFSLRLAAETALWPLRSLLCLRSRLLLSTALLNTLFSALASCTLYELSCKVLQCRRQAALSAVLFCLTPANVFMAAAYSESLFALLTFSAMCQLEKGQPWLSSLLFALATGVRSNGVINAGFLVYFQAKCFSSQLQLGTRRSLKPMHILGCSLNMAAFLVVTSTLVFLPFALFQLYAYLRFCKPSAHSGYAVPEPFLQLAVDKGYRVAVSNGLEPPWCVWNLPVVYAYVQDAYWNVGFLRYFEPKQIPNFLLAAPTILLGFWAAWWYISANPWHCLTLGLVKSKTGGGKGEAAAKPLIGFCSAGAFVYVIHATALLVFGTFCMHVQVITRFLGSSSPVLYWFSAHLLHTRESLLQNGGSTTQQTAAHFEKPLLCNSFPSWKLDDNPVVTLLSNWRRCNILTKCILGYVLSYWLLGLLLHCNFFPWT